MNVDSTSTTASSSKDKGKKKESPETPETLRIARPKQYTACIDSTLVKQASNWEKAEAINKIFLADQNFRGARTTTYRGRKLVLAYFDSLSARDAACIIPILLADKKTLVPFLKEDIDNDIKSGRDKEKNASIRVTGIPLSYDAAAIKSIFENRGEIARYSFVPGDKSHVAYIVDKNPKSVDQFRADWFIYIKKDMVRVTPLDLTEKEVTLRSSHCIKLTGLTLHTYSKDLQELTIQLEAKLCIVPHSGDDRPANHAFLYFESQDKLDAALTSRDLSFGGNPLYFVPTNVKACHNCGHPDHLVKECKRQKIRYPPLPRPVAPYRPTPPDHFASWDDEMEDYYSYSAVNTNNRREQSNRFANRFAKSASYADMVNRNSQYPSK